MLSDLNTIVQFFSALYVTIAIDNMMFNRFWTPDVFAVVENALKKFDFALSTPKQQELLNVIKNRSVEIDKRISHFIWWFDKKVVTLEIIICK